MYYLQTQKSPSDLGNKRAKRNVSFTYGVVEGSTFYASPP